MPLAVLLFLALVLWWDGTAKGSIGFGRVKFSGHSARRGLANRPCSHYVSIGVTAAR